MFTGEDVRALLIGTLGSVTAWYVLQRMRVRYEWTPWISERLPDEDSPGRYAIKITRTRAFDNRLRRRIRAAAEARGHHGRHLVDVQIRVTLRIDGVPGFHHTRLLAVGVARWLPAIRATVVLPLWVDAMEQRDLVRLPQELRTLLERPNVTLREVLEMSRQGLSVKMRAVAIGYDSFSGSRCVYTSPDWSAAHIKRGAFTGLRIVPWKPLDDERIWDE